MANVLVVDDSPTVVKLLTRDLVDAGHEVISATNGLEALELLEQHRPQVVVTDWMMPQMDGLDLCRAIRKRQEDHYIYLIVLTALAHKDRLVEAFDAGADDYLTKPFLSAELFARLNAGVRITELEADLAAQQEIATRANEQLVALNESLHELATIDELTRLFNRRQAMETLETLWATSRRKNTLLSCIMFDIDYFKRCNDTYGHDVGDAVLRQTAGVLKQVMRSGETLYRVGGEEFLVLCFDTTIDQAIHLGERLRQTVEANTIEHGDVNLSVTISVGVAQIDGHTVGTAGLLKQADEALYAAKKSGRNRVCHTSVVNPRLAG